MRENIRLLSFLASLWLMLTPAVGNAGEAESAIRAKIDVYTKSIDAADPELGATVWATTPQSSFIHPLGHERSWEAIKNNFYGKIMGGALKDRHLKLVGDPSIHVYGDSAVVEFDWDFTAVIKEGDKPIHTTGRESQVYRNIPGAGWKIVHIHYSPPPANELSRGL